MAWAPVARLLARSTCLVQFLLVNTPHSQRRQRPTRKKAWFPPSGALLAWCCEHVHNKVPPDAIVINWIHVGVIGIVEGNCAFILEFVMVSPIERPAFSTFASFFVGHPIHLTGGYHFYD